MSKILSTLFIGFILVFSSAVSADDYMKSTIMALKDIHQTVNNTSFNKKSYENLQEYQKVMLETNKLTLIAKEFGAKLTQKAVYSMPIKGEDLAIMRALMSSVVIIMDKTNIYTSKALKNGAESDEIKKAQRELISYLAKINYVKIYLSAYDVFYRNHKVKNVALEVLKMVENPKQKEILKKFAKIAHSDEFNEKLQLETNRFIENHYYYLKLLNPTVTKAVVMVEDQNITDTILGRTIPAIKFTNPGTWFIELWNRTTNFISGVFGNLVGAIRFRHGYMFEHNKALSELKKTLRPLDIIAEKTPFAATDFFIPGHFGHIAIYLGTEEQLREHGLWNTPLIQKYKHLIREGKTIVESIRPGSRMVSLEDFLEIDEITIIREDNILDNNWQSKMTAEIALEQLWKDYDFNFDVATLDKVVCSEVPYHAFGHKRWATSYIFGRHTISPDEIIQNAYTKDSGISFVASLKAKKDKTLVQVSKEEMASNLELKYNANRDLFTKREKRCRLIKIKKNDQTQRSSHYKKCISIDMPLIYSNI